MPNQFLPRKSGAHRIACIALYRALLTQCPRIPLPPDLPLRGKVNPIKHFIRKRFRQNVEHTSPRLVVGALRAGYAAEELLRHAASGHLPSLSQTHSFLRSLSSQHLSARSICRPKPRSLNPPPRVFPYPGATKVLDSRPLPREDLKEGKRRRIPILTKATLVPFLRFKKPQSPFLSRVLRDKIRGKQRRFDRMEEVGERGLIGEREEEWEGIVREKASGRHKRVERGGDRERERDWAEVWNEGNGVEGGKKGKKEEERWGAREKAHKNEIMGLVIQDARNSKWTGDRMLEIVDREKELRAEEDKERRVEKMRKKREQKKKGEESPNENF